jgi:NAD(P)-dependent dehydrogenase (short-subunit alcohol dehydrogenase family)
MSEPSQALVGRHALVTGAARGIGLACVQSLLARGAKVTLLGRNAAALDAAVQTLDAPDATNVVTADVADAASVQAAFARAAARFGPVQILVNNAGQAVSQPFARTDATLWKSMLSVNLDGTFHCMHAALPDMLQAGWGRIVNVASTAGLIGYAYVSAYVAAKHGVIGLTRSVALEVARKGITVNAVCPGYTETDIVRTAVATIVQKTGLTEDQARAKLAERNPQGKLIQPEEVAEAVAWLALPSSGAVNGQAISVDGGEVMTG